MTERGRSAFDPVAYFFLFTAANMLSIVLTLFPLTAAAAGAPPVRVTECDTKSQKLTKRKNAPPFLLGRPRFCPGTDLVVALVGLEDFTSSSCIMLLNGFCKNFNSGILRMATWISLTDQHYVRLGTRI
jgi:hypothetical protein